MFHLTEESPCNSSGEIVDSISPQTLFDTLLNEAATMSTNSDLCSEHSPSLPHSSSFVFSARVSSAKHPYADFFMFSRENPPVGLHVLTREGATNNPGLLRNFVGAALGVDTSLIHSIFTIKTRYLN